VGTDFPLPPDSSEAQEWFKKFEDLGISETTSFDWSRLSQQIRHVKSEENDNVEAQPGTMIEVYQVVGVCGKRSVLTSRFETLESISRDLENCVPRDDFELVIQCDATAVQVI
jgi:hypothetical protein